jgi:hypothetical protein
MAGEPRKIRMAKVGLRNDSKDTSARLVSRPARILGVKPSKTDTLAITALAA